MIPRFESVFFRFAALTPPRVGVTLAVVLASTAVPGVAFADEPPTFADRVDESGEGSTRSLALLIHPLDIAAGVYGIEGDFAITNGVALALEGDVGVTGGRLGLVVGVGLPFFPLRPVFHGLYLEPRLVFVRRADESPFELDGSTDAFGAGGTAGWEWTWDYGFSARLGAGAMSYLGNPGAGAPASLRIGDTVAVLVADVSAGWAF
jgi:hypothetical protein